MSDTIVIGAGLNGLVTAAYLAPHEKVVVLEKRSQVGGRMARREFAEGFKGAAAIGFGVPLRPRVVKDLHLDYYGLEHIAHDPLVYAPIPGKPALTLWKDPHRAAESIARYSPQDAKNYPEYVAFMTRAQEFAEQLLDVTPTAPESSEFYRLLDLANLGVRFRTLGKSDMHRLMRLATMSVDDWLSEWFETDALKAILALPAVRERFCAPRSPGTAATLIYDALGGPCGAPRGGFAGLAETLATSVKDSGGEVRTGAEVAEIMTRNGAVVGVKLASGEELAASRVISALDPKRTLLGLLPALSLEPSLSHRIERIRSRGTTAILNVALNGLPEFEGLSADDARQVLRGRIQVGTSIEALERAYDPIKYGRLPERPVLEAVIPSLSDPSLAPSGQHLMQIRATWAPYHLREGDWDKLKDGFAKTILKLMGEVSPGFEAKVQASELLSPLDLEREYGLTEGHLHHGEHNLNQLYFGRPVPGCNDYHTPVEGLWLCGAGCHPGGGTHGAAGANAAHEVLHQKPGMMPALKRAKAAVGTPVGAGLAVSAGLALLGAGLAAGSALKSMTKPKKPGNKSKKLPIEPTASDEKKEA